MMTDLLPSTRALGRLADFLSRLRLDMAQEKRAQGELEQLLTTAGIAFEREKRLSAKDIPDFLVTLDGVRIAVEMKTRARRMAIFRQLERYAEHGEVDALLLFTGTAMGLPPAINNKPACVVSMGAAWL
ncbi:hypothetical protein [Geopseudomonas aromaticivorans]